MPMNPKLIGIKMKTLVVLIALFITSCATNEHDAAIETARYNALENINAKLNEPDVYDCESKCTITVASRNKVTFTAEMLQEFGAIDRLIAGGVSITEIVARGIFNPTTLGFYAMYKGLESVAENGGTHIVNTDSYNQHSEANQANQSSVETVSGIKAGGNVDQSVEVNTSISKPITSTITETDNSVNNSNNSSTVIKEPVVTEEVEQDE